MKWRSSIASFLQCEAAWRPGADRRRNLLKDFASTGACTAAYPQELSHGRLLLGVGVGSMLAEFRVVGVPFAQRGAISDRALAFIHRCFEADEVVENGQPFLFLPRPERPPIYVGGSGDHAIRRITRYGEGWIAPRSDPAELRSQIAALQEAMAAAGRGPAQVLPLAALPLDDPPAAIDRVYALREVGVTGLIH